jgi:hypothetical protein
MPAVDDQRGRSFTEIVEIAVHRIELIGYRPPRELQHSATEPVGCSAQAACFTGCPID